MHHSVEQPSCLMEQIEQSLLVTGCGRSGTNYMARFLEKSGCDIHHEREGAQGCVSWPMAVNYYSPWLEANECSFDHIFHQTRHPLDVISSWYHNLDDLDRDEWNFIRAHLPQISRSDSLIVHCAKYWYYWNLLAEEKAEWRYRIEEIDFVLPEFQDRSGLTLEHSTLQQMDKTHNRWKPIVSKITWMQLEMELPRSLYENLIEMSLRYGYESPENSYTQMNSKVGNSARPAPQIWSSEAASKQLNLNKLSDADGSKNADVR